MPRLKKAAESTAEETRVRVPRKPKQLDFEFLENRQLLATTGLPPTITVGRVLSAYAVGVSNSLARQGITEVGNSREYWKEIDKQLREKFPERFEAQTERPVNGSRPVAVASATRTNGAAPVAQRGPRHVTLSESQVKLARSLGLSNEKYAMQLVRDEHLAEGSYHDVLKR